MGISLFKYKKKGGGGGGVRRWWRIKAPWIAFLPVPQSCSSEHNLQVSNLLVIWLVRLRKSGTCKCPRSGLVVSKITQYACTCAQMCVKISTMLCNVNSHSNSLWWIAYRDQWVILEAYYLRCFGLRPMATQWGDRKTEGEWDWGLWLVLQVLTRCRIYCRPQTLLPRVEMFTWLYHKSS